MKRISTFLVLIAGLIGAATPIYSQQPDAPAPVVVVSEVKIKPLSDPEIFSGAVEALDEVSIVARVEGVLESVEFGAGDAVEEGQELFRIDSAPYDAAVAASEAKVAQAEAQLLNAQQQLSRQEVLSERNVSAVALLEDAIAAEAIARANVAAAKAELQQSELQQGYTRISAPFASEITHAFYSEGALVGPSSGPLARLVKTDPVRIVFSISDKLLIEMRSQEAAGSGTNAADLVFRVLLGNGEVYPTTAEPEYISNEADSATGTVPVRLVLENPDGILIPGQFVNVSVDRRNPPELPVVPQIAVLQNRDGRFVYIVNDDGTVAMRQIETGMQVGNELSVVNGLDGGETVVTQGLQRIADGMTVRIADTAAETATDKDEAAGDVN